MTEKYTKVEEVVAEIESIFVKMQANLDESKHKRDTSEILYGIKWLTDELIFNSQMLAKWRDLFFVVKNIDTMESTVTYLMDVRAEFIKQLISFNQSPTRSSSPMANMIASSETQVIAEIIGRSIIQDDSLCALLFKCGVDVRLQ